MEKLSLEQIKQVEVDILKNFDAFCRQNNIRYFLSNGTLLGAAKYKGFIPWDDDIDVCLPREDYDRFIAEYPPSGKYELLCSERNSGYIFPYAKLSDTSTVIKNQVSLKNYTYGVHVDIFPLDYWNDDLQIAKKQIKKLEGIANNLIMSIASFSLGRTFLRTCAKTVWCAAAHIKGHKRISTELNDEIIKTKNNSGERYCGCIVWPIHGEGEILPADIFGETVYLEFEGGEYPAPMEYDAYLKNLYGEWSKELPQKKQRSHHKFNAYKIS